MHVHTYMYIYTHMYTCILIYLYIGHGDVHAARHGQALPRGARKRDKWGCDINANRHHHHHNVYYCNYYYY